MKNLIFCLSILSLILCLYSCNDDESISPENTPEIELTEAHSDSPLQGEDRTCSMEQHMSRLMTDPNYRKVHQEKFARLEGYAAYYQLG